MTVDRPAIAEAVATGLAAAAEPLTAAALHKRLRRRFPALTEPELFACLEALIEAGRIHLWPLLPGARVPRYGALAPDPKDYLRAPVRVAFAALEHEVQRLTTLGLKHERVLAAARELIEESSLFTGVRGPKAMDDGNDAPASNALYGEALDRSLLEEIGRLGETQRHGGLVSIRELRHALVPRLPDPRSFDGALLALARRGAVWLYKHDFPAGLTEAERSGMVSDGQGNYYNGVSLKE